MDQRGLHALSESIVRLATHASRPPHRKGNAERNAEILRMAATHSPQEIAAALGGGLSPSAVYNVIWRHEQRQRQCEARAKRLQIAKARLAERGIVVTTTV